jgi:stage IV sporulation protein B
MPPKEAAPVPVGEAETIKKGAAEIVSNVRGTEVRRYAVQILELYPSDSQDRNLLLQVTDPDLLNLTGGIVQGMSGSPILQNGYLVGAVTHVLIDDPTQGYGIFIENMLDAAS